MVHSCACRLLLSVTELLSVCGECGIAHCPHSSLSLDTGSLLGLWLDFAEEAGEGESFSASLKSESNVRCFEGVRQWCLVNSLDMESSTLPFVNLVSH